MRLQSCALLIALTASRAYGQVKDAPSRPVDVWASVSLGGGAIRHVQQSTLSVRAAAWTGLGHAVFGVRRASAGPFFVEPNSGVVTTAVTDYAVLGGFRAMQRPDSRSVLSGAAQFTVGPAVMSARVQQGLEPQRKVGPDPAFAFDGDATVHARVIGIGLSLFGAISPHYTYSAVALTLSLGKIH